MIHERRQAEPVVEQRHAVRDGELEARLRVAEERKGRVGTAGLHLHLVRRDDLVAVRVAPGERANPVAVDRVAFDLTNVAGPDRRNGLASRILTERDDLVGQVRGAERDVPAQEPVLEDLLLILY